MEKGGVGRGLKPEDSESVEIKVKRRESNRKLMIKREGNTHSAAAVRGNERLRRGDNLTWVSQAVGWYDLVLTFSLPSL